MKPPHAARELIRYYRYRRQFHQADRRQVMIVIIVATIALCGTTRNDFSLLSGTSLLYASLFFRLIQLITTLVLLGFLQRTRRPTQLDWIGGTWAVMTTSCLVLIDVVTRLPVRETQGPILGLCAATTIFYFAQRGRLCGRILASAVAALGLVILIFHPASNASLALKTTGPIAILLLNILGIASARSFEEQRRKRFEAEREERRARRELAIKNQELAVQKDHAEAMYKARTAFLAAMSHEFRTPMNAVIGLSDVLVNAPLEPEYREHARTIRDSASSLLTLLNDVLDFAKIDAGKLELSLAPFDLRALLGSVVDMMQPAARSKNITLATQFAPDLPAYILGDDARFRQVLVNLLSNAIKFTAAGAVTFVVTCQPQEKPLHKIGFSVTDTGIGMSSEVLKRLFRPFEQGDGGIGRRFGGTGLGLVISQQIIRAMGGEIRVESQLGKGSTFSFSVPFEETTAPVPAERDSQSLPRSDQLSILVVDDLAINRTVARTMLKRLGYTADFANDGQSAINAVMNKEYDVVFMDLQMPEMSGIEATRVITEKLAGKRLPRIIAMSASVFEEDRAACRAVGMVDFVAKPMEIEKLDGVLRKVSRKTDRSISKDAEVTSLDLAPIGKLRELETFDQAGLVEELCRDFLVDVPVRLLRMRDAVVRHEWAEIERDAHGLKSTSASLGAMNMSRICARIEAAARSGRSEDISRLVDQLKTELPLVQAAMKRENLV